MPGGRRGSVTRLLQDAPEYYSPPSPSECPEPEEDCWGGVKPRPRRAPKRAAEAKTSEEESAADTKKDKDVDQKATQPQAASTPAICNKASVDAATEADAKNTDAKKSNGGPGNAHMKDAKKQGEHKGASPEEEEEEEIQPPKLVFMHGCSAAYQRAVEHVRGPTVVPSVVVLGLPESEQEKEAIDTCSSQMDRSSFVAVAASKMKLKGAKSEDDRSDVLVQDLRRDDKSRPGKKFFEDAYISTWSQSILPADEPVFIITFNTRDKPPLRARRVSRQRLPEKESSEMDASEWSDWRSVHDRVEQWLRDNARVEPDESHILTILQDLDAKKGILFR